MTSPNNPIQPPAADLEPTAPEFSFVKPVQEMLANPDLDGRVIADRFIGAVVARGNYTKADGSTMSPQQALDDIAGAVRLVHRKVSADTYVTWEQALTTVTRTDGLRETASILGSDERTGVYLDQMSQRIKSEHGDITLISLDQVAGYLDTKAASASQYGTPSAPWLSTMLHSVTEHASTAPATRSRWSSSDLTTAESPVIREPQVAFERANIEARRAGVDPELLARSAEEIKRRNLSGEYIGHVAASGIAEPAQMAQNYDHLFEA